MAQRRYTYRFVLVLLLLAGCCDLVWSQRPYHQNDPLYRNESAFRTFFDTYAVAADVTYGQGQAPSVFLLSQDLATEKGWVRKVDSPEDQTPDRSSVVPTGSPLSLNVRVDYRLLPQLDASLIFEVDGITSGSASLDWVALKYYGSSDDLDYAVRFATNPGLEFSGFPQVDLSLFTHNRLSPAVSSNLVIGWRRVRYGFAKSAEDTPDVPSVLSRAGGQEVHLMRHYQVSFDPASSYFYIGGLAKLGSYDLVDSYRLGDTLTPAEGGSSESIRGGTLWLRAGMQFNRPTYQVMPYLSLPVVSLGQLKGDFQLGLRLTLR